MGEQAMPDSSEQVCANSEDTQTGPTFSRSGLGADKGSGTASHPNKSGDGLSEQCEFMRRSIVRQSLPATDCALTPRLGNAPSPIPLQTISVPPGGPVRPPLASGKWSRLGEGTRLPPRSSLAGRLRSHSEPHSDRNRGRDLDSGPAQPGGGIPGRHREILRGGTGWLDGSPALGTPAHARIGGAYRAVHKTMPSERSNLPMI